MSCFQRKCRILKKSKIAVPPVFSLLQQLGNVPEKEMWLTFNMGVGLVLVVRENEKKEILEKLASLGYAAGNIGIIEKRKSGKNGVSLV